MYIANDNELYRSHDTTYAVMNRIQMGNVSEFWIVNLMTLIYLINLELDFL